MNKVSTKSVPKYSPLAYDKKARFNLLVGLVDGVNSLINVLQGSDGNCNVDNTKVLISAEISARENIRARFNNYQGIVTHIYDNETRLLIALPKVFKEMHMGLRMYCVGAEQFIGDVYCCAVAQGLHRSEFQLEVCGSMARRVYCVHCNHFIESIKTNIVECNDCHLMLTVSDHFSRKLNAYLGVRVDTEIPGKLPDVQEIYQ